jgi:hypothetical protein
VYWQSPFSVKVAIRTYQYGDTLSPRIAARYRPEFTSTEAAPQEAGVTAQTGSIAGTLMLVARHHCQLPADVIERLAALAADVQPRSTGTVTRKNRDRLRQFDDPAVRAHLLHLPPRLMRQAEVLSDHPKRAAFIERYVSRFRPTLAAEGSLFLFPAGRTSDRPLAVDTLRYHIVRKVRDEVGAVINPHLFRSLVARFSLEHASGSLEDVRQLLGDKSMATVLAHYTSIEPSHAGRRHDDMLRRVRDRPKTVAGKRWAAAPGGAQ